MVEDIWVPEEILHQVSHLHFSDRDNKQYQQMKVDKKQTDEFKLVKLHDEWKIYVPSDARRSLFWLLHSDLHSSSTKILADFHELGLYWPKAASTVDEFLSQCLCTLKKDSKPHPYSF